jgi:hypothetical protein
MKKVRTLLVSMLVVAVSSLATSCTDDGDDRAWEDVKIMGVKVDGELFTPTYTEGVTTVTIPAGRDLSNVKLQVLVSNGRLTGMVNDTEYDCRKPLDVTLEGSNGQRVTMKLRIQSPPKLSTFIVEGVNVPSDDVFISPNSIIAQVPEETPLSALKVTMVFVNGTLTDFENGVALDYTQPRSFNVRGVDGETIYPYDLIITTEPVGPAFVKALIINGVKTDSVKVNAGVLTPYIPSLMDFSSVDVEFEVGFGNQIDPAFVGTGLNLLSGTNKVTISGSDRVNTEFTIGVPQLSLAPVVGKTYTELGFAANDLAAVGFSGQYVLAGNYSAGNRLPIIYDLTGERVGQMDATGIDPTGYGIRKFATDSKGAVLVLSLGMSAGEQWVYKFDSATGTGTPYISFSKASLGLDVNPRSAGISISGSLDGDAIITMGIAQRTEIFVWKVTGGVLNSTPTKYAFPYTGTSYYWSVQPMPIGRPGFIAFATANNPDFPSGIVCLTETMAETQKLTGMVITDGKTVLHKGRVYVAFTVFATTKAIMRICDITSGEVAAYRNPIFNLDMPLTGGNGNATVDADFAVIDGKLHAAFASSNHGMYVYCLEN